MGNNVGVVADVEVVPKDGCYELRGALGCPGGNWRKGSVREGAQGAVTEFGTKGR